MKNSSVKTLVVSSLLKASVATSLSLFLFACGEDTTTEKIVEVAVGGTEVVESVGDLPKCTKDNDGELVLVKGESSIRICADGKWFATKDTVYQEAADFSCTTKELKDKSGLKIICNGDSIGVVLNGAKGATGAAGKDGDECAVEEQTDSTVVINCGGQAMTLNLGTTAPHDSLQPDSEKIAVSLDTLAGVSQKGPFLKGSTVYLYELSDGRTLKQTNGNFVSDITSDDGSFRFTTRNLMSQYALIMVDGKYRNEVTGKPTNTTIRLRAYTDVLSRKKANVNLLTHLERKRVYYLVTQEKKRFKVAKHQAQMEILDAFHIDTTEINKSSEDLNVFGSSDADVALLAISVLLQGNDDETALSVLLTEIAEDIESDGLWNDDATRTQIADRAFALDLSQVRKNVESWGLNKGGKIGNFESIIENFIADEFGAERCGVGDDDETRRVNNKRSSFYGETYHCLNGMFVIRSDNKYFNKEIEYGMLLDWRDRHAYKTVKIGDWVWMAENLNYEYKLKPYGRDQYETYGSLCNSDSCRTYGRYYTWAVAMDSAAIFTENGRGCGSNKSCSPIYPVRGICPEGWHLPSNSEWNPLSIATGGSANAVRAMGYENWASATDAYGFSVLPTDGYYEDHFGNVGVNANFWSSSEFDSKLANRWSVQDSTSTGIMFNDKAAGFTVRCVLDYEVDEHE